MTIKIKHIIGNRRNCGRIIALASRGGNTGPTGNWPDNDGGITAARLYCEAARRAGHEVDDRELARLTTGAAK